MKGKAFLRTLCGCERTVELEWPPETMTYVVGIPRRPRPITDDTLVNEPSHGQRVFKLLRLDHKHRVAEYMEQYE